MKSNLISLKLTLIVGLLGSICLLMFISHQQSEQASTQSKVFGKQESAVEFRSKQVKISATKVQSSPSPEQLRKTISPLATVSFVDARLRRIEMITALSSEQRRRLEYRFQIAESIRRSAISASEIQTALSELESLDSIIGEQAAAQYEKTQALLRSTIYNESVHRDLLRLADKNGFLDDVKFEIDSLLQQVKDLNLTPLELRSFVKSSLQEVFGRNGSVKAFENYLSTLPPDIVEEPLVVSVASEELREKVILYRQQTLDLDSLQTEKVRQLEMSAQAHFKAILEQKSLENPSPSAAMTSSQYAQAFKEVQERYDSELRVILKPAQFDRYKREQSNSSFNKLTGIEAHEHSE